MAKVRKKATHPPNLIAMKTVIDAELKWRDLNEEK
jgi:hypothetical protein